MGRHGVSAALAPAASTWSRTSRRPSCSGVARTGSESGPKGASTAAKLETAYHA